MSYIGLKDTMPFGKHKGEKIEDIIKNGDGEYLLWLRAERLEQNSDARFFSVEVNDRLTTLRDSDKRFRAKFTEWKPAPDMTPERSAAIIKKAIADAAAPKEEVAIAYAGWGAY